MTFRPVLVALATVALSATAACGGSSNAPGSTNQPDPTHPTTTDPNAPADPIADPVPTNLPTLLAHGPDADIAPDLSCAGQPLPVTTSPLTQREFHLTELGGDDTARVGGLPVQLFFDNDPSHAADLTVTSGTAEGGDKKNVGVFEANTPSGFVAFHVAKTESYVETTALDLDLRGAAPFLATVAPQGTVSALSILIGGSSYTPVPGASRVVVRAVDCKGNPLAGAHVALEVDGVVTAIATGSADGIRRSYFGDTELPSDGKWTSRSGVAAFLDVPTGKSLRLVVRGNSGSGAPTVVAMRKVPSVADGVVTAKISPYTTK